MINQDGAMAQELEVLLSAVQPGAPIKIDEISVVPLIGAAPGPEAVLLEEALEAGSAVVEELGEAGSVQEVKVSFTGRGVLLLLDGEELLGAKQNRVFNASFLVPPGPPVVIPVSCVEQGRWRYTSRSFSSAGRTLSSRARSAKLRRVQRSVSTTRTYNADQGAVWSDVDDILRRTHVSSPSSAYADAAEARAEGVETSLAKLTPLPEQQGLAVVHGGRVVAMDIFGGPALYQRAWRKLARGILMEMFEPAAGSRDPKEAVQDALDVAVQAKIVRTPAPGAGETLHGEDSGHVLGAVVHQGAVYHLEIAASA